MHCKKKKKRRKDTISTIIVIINITSNNFLTNRCWFAVEYDSALLITSPTDTHTEKKPEPTRTSTMKGQVKTEKALDGSRGTERPGLNRGWGSGGEWRGQVLGGLRQF